MKKLKKRNFDRLLAAFITVMVMVNMPVYAFAAEKNVIDTSKAVSLTIYKYDENAALAAGVKTDGLTANGLRNESAEIKLEKYAIKGVEFTYLKISDIKTKNDGNTIYLVYKIPEKLEDILGLSAESHTYTSEVLAGALDRALMDNTGTKDKLEAYIESAGGTAMPKTDEKGMTGCKNVPQGLYLLVETMVPDQVSKTVNPFFVSLPMTDVKGEYWFYDVFAYPKNQTNLPAIDKLVAEDGEFADTATASEGDTLHYRIVSRLPEITSKATWLQKYDFRDSICDGIDYCKNVTVEFYEKQQDAEQGGDQKLAEWDAEGDFYRVTYADQEKTMKVSFTADGLEKINREMSGRFIAVCYDAEVRCNDDVIAGDQGNSNAVELTYKRSSDSEETLKDKATVYTYGINLTKEFNGENGDPEAVQFVLKNVTDGYYLKAEGSNGVYYITDNEKAEKEKDAAVFSPDSEGHLIINGLEADTYELCEIKTAPGFMLLKEPVTLTFTVTNDVITPSAATMTGHENEHQDVVISNLDRASCNINGEKAEMEASGASANAKVKVKVINNEGFSLPYTGGKGMTAINLIGVAAVISGMYAARRKKDETCQ